jgi:hypothetical protein
MQLKALLLKRCSQNKLIASPTLVVYLNLQAELRKKLFF